MHLVIMKLTAYTLMNEVKSKRYNEANRSFFLYFIIQLFLPIVK